MKFYYSLHKQKQKSCEHFLFIDNLKTPAKGKHVEQVSITKYNTSSNTMIVRKLSSILRVVSTVYISRLGRYLVALGVGARHASGTEPARVSPLRRDEENWAWIGRPTWNNPLPRFQTAQTADAFRLTARYLKFRCGLKGSTSKAIRDSWILAQLSDKIWLLKEHVLIKLYRLS